MTRVFPEGTARNGLKKERKTDLEYVSLSRGLHSENSHHIIALAHF